MCGHVGSEDGGGMLLRNDGKYTVLQSRRPTSTPRIFSEHACSYCCSHITRTTTWEDPRKTLAAQVAQSQQQTSADLISNVAGSPHSSSSPQPQGNCRQYNFCSTPLISHFAPFHTPPTECITGFYMILLSLLSWVSSVLYCK